MIKRLIIYLIIYAAILITIVYTLSEMETLFLLAIVISGLGFGIIIIFEVYKQYIAGSKPKNYNLEYTSSNVQNLNKISQRPFLFGLEKKIISDGEFYFDDENFYVLNDNNETAKFNLNSITELSRTSIRINNSTIWQVKINHKEEKLIFKFAHNYTIWNKNFLLFYEKLKAINPTSIKSKWSLWKM
ncbi:hypothetical protein LUD75_07520 [Epilithonimonas sp. JDS]|uniref:hypothetical protein n=1 Tax=Epilithonimonas sp. JDS TaxID=2902797 RepID=UPI001E56F09B|nr:hypothetical protein [Epilithonimonas sp. JDS]MCD9854550.1 hypothetical protein [Epilithonimonas sp. JDS]